MYLHSCTVRNYRRMRDVHIELAQDISIFVGANNSGKTSATQAIHAFLSGSKDKFSLFDFSSHTWAEFDEIGNLPHDTDPLPPLPSISIDLWLEVAATDLHLVVDLLPSTAWQGTQVGIRIEFACKNPDELLQRFRTAQADASQKAAQLEGGAGTYVPWPKNLTTFLQKELQAEYELRYFVLDRAQFNAEFQPNEGYQPDPIFTEKSGQKSKSGPAILRSLIRVDQLNAQRHLADPSTSASVGGGRSEDLSKRLSRFYQRNLDQKQEDHSALRALFLSENELNAHLAVVFKPTLDRIAKLGYPGLNNPKLEIRSALNPASILSQDARVHYKLGDGENEIALPDTYNGLGFKNLIYMVVEILDLHARWVSEEEDRPPLHLIFIEEPEAHLHAQLQQVFIRNVLSLLNIDDATASALKSQVVVTTHSPHILYERGFKPIRYFRRLIDDDGHQKTEVLNLSAFYAKETDDRDFLERYLKLTHCDLFFADAAILVEGNVERLLLPLMIEREAKSLRSACLCILEVGGAFGHKFKSLLDFLGLTALVITDIDSVSLVEATAANDDESDEKEFETPAEAEGQPPTQRKGKACVVGTTGAVTSNQTLIQWLPKLQTIAELLNATLESKTQEIADGTRSKIRVTYQVGTDVTWNETTENLCGRTLEEAFGLENAAWCQAEEQKRIGLRLRTPPNSPTALALALHKKVNGSGFDKTNFALGVLTAPHDAWVVPKYIRDGLTWLKEQVSLESPIPALIENTDAAPQPAPPEGPVQ